MEQETKLHWADRLKWWNAYLFIACGAVMIYRTYGTEATWLSMLTGVVFVAFGLYRLRLFQRVLRGDFQAPVPRWKRNLKSSR